MKRTALFALAMGLALAANAQQQTNSTEPAGAAPVDALVVEDADADAARVAEQQAREGKPDRTCLTRTGSRLIRRDITGYGCAAATGRSYTRDDLERTGAPDVSRALRMLDPSIN